MNKHNEQDIRSKVAIINASVNNMCNVKTTEEVNSEFMKLKDLLIELYKCNIERTK